MKKKDLFGLSFEYLNVLDHGTWFGGKYYFTCQCVCGIVKKIQGAKLTRGQVRSCGCKSTELRLRHKDYSISALKLLFSHYKASAKNRNIFFNLLFEDFSKIVQKECNYCGVRSDISKQYKGHKKSRMGKNKITDLKMLDVEIMGSGLDRVDSNSGYIIENVVPCCAQCNFAKLDYSQEEFYEWIDRINKKRGIIGYDCKCSW